MTIRAQILRLEAAMALLRDADPADLSPLRDAAESLWASRRSRPTFSARLPPGGGWSPPRVSRPAAAVAEQLVAAFDGVALNPSAPRHFGWVPGGGTAAAALGDYFAALSNAYAGYRVPSPAAVEIELSLLHWMTQLLGLPETTAGDLCAGGSPANAVALHAASPRVSRALAGERSDLAVLPHDLDAIVYVSEERHRCIDKALRFIGHGGRLHTVAGDAAGRMDPDALAARIRQDTRSGAGWPWLVVASAGTTSTGLVDPLRPIAAVCAEAGLWLHVDAAYGGFFALAASGRGRLDGIELADSVVLDPHKGLFQPYGLGVALIRDGRRLYAAHATEQAYIREPGAIGVGIEQLMGDGSAMFRSPELSRPFRALRLWVSLQVHGSDAFAAALEHRLLLARHAWRRLSALSGVEVLEAPDLSIVPFRLSAPEGAGGDVQERAVQALRQDHDVFVTSTVVRGQAWLRLAILTLQTTLADVDAAVDAVARVAADGASTAP